jgi:putative tryptophan/tyrosine transport system substrate-binding protein
MADLVRRRVDVIATPGNSTTTLAAIAATSTIPIVFGVGLDPAEGGLVASLARPRGNATGINYFSREVAGKRLGLLHEFVPKVVRVAVLVNPANTPLSEILLRNLREAARIGGMQIQIFNASTISEIDARFAAFGHHGIDALFVNGDAFFSIRRVQLATLAVRERVPTAFASRDLVAAGGLMSYGTDLADMFRQVGAYTGQVLKGVKPANLPVQQSTKFEFVLNLQTARTLGVEVPPMLLAIADQVIE